MAGDPLIHFIDRGNQTAGQHVPRRPVRRRTSAATPCRSARSARSPPSPTASRPGRGTSSRSRAPARRARSAAASPCSRAANEVLRYQGVDSDPVNWGWLCDKGRFDFEAVNSDERLARAAGRARATSWSPTAWARGARRRGRRCSQTALDRRRPGVDRRPRRRPRHQRGRVRLGQAGQGRHRHRQRRRPARRRAARRGRARPARGPRSTRPARPTHRRAARPRPQGGAAGPLPAPARRRRAATASASSSSARRDTGPHAVRVASLRYRPGEPAPLVRARRRRPTTGSASTPTARRVREQLGQGPVVVVVGRAIAGRAARPSPPPLCRASAARFLPALRRGNVHGALDMGLAPGLLPGRVALDDGRRGSRPLADAAGRARPRRRRHPRRPPPTGGSTCSSCSAPTRSPTSPTATWPARALAGAAHGHRRRHASSPTSSRQADVVLAAAGFAEVAARRPTSRVGSRTLGQKVTPPGTARRRLDDRRRAGRAASAPTSASTSVERGHRAEIAAAVSPRTPRRSRRPRSPRDARRRRSVDAIGAGHRSPTVADAAPPPRATPTSLRLVVEPQALRRRRRPSRTSPSLAAAGARARALHLHPLDLDRLGVADGDRACKVVEPRAPRCVLDVERRRGRAARRGRGCRSTSRRRPPATLHRRRPRRVTDVRVENLADDAGPCSPPIRCCHGDIDVGRRRHRPPQGRHHLRLPAGRHDVHDLVRAQGHRRHAEPHRPEPGRPVGHPADAGRRHQAFFKEDLHPRARRPLRLPPGARTSSVVPPSSSFAVIPIGGDFTNGNDGVVTHLRPRHATCSWPTRRSASCSSWPCRRSRSTA